MQRPFLSPCITKDIAKRYCEDLRKLSKKEQMFARLPTNTTKNSLKLPNVKRLANT